jgi:dienelactone hydrolase
MASATTSGLKTADAAIAVGVNRVNTLTILTDGTNAATVVLYDNPSAASGTVLAKGICIGADRTLHMVFENPVKASTGIYADVTGTGAEYIVTYGG